MALGDQVIVLIDVGGGKVREEIVRAQSAGGKVLIEQTGGLYGVMEVSRNDRSIRGITVPSARLVAIIEQPKGR